MKASNVGRFGLFVAHCSGAATVSYLLAHAIGLPYPVWAAISAVIVAQARLNETVASVIGRISGTLVGVVIAVAVQVAAKNLAVGMPVQIAVAVAISAVIARIQPTLRVCMWTTVIVLLTASPSVPVGMAGVYRGAEVILGGLVSGLFHLVAERIAVTVNWTETDGEKHVQDSSLSDE